MAIVNGKPVYIFKKALLLIHVIYLRFASTAPFPIPETAELPVFSDNVLPSMLIHFGIIDLSTCDPVLGLDKVFTDAKDSDRLDGLLGRPLERKEDNGAKEMPREGPILALSQAYIVRAAAIEACETIISVGRSLVVTDEGLNWINGIRLPELDGWLWAAAKDRDDYRRLERVVLRDTEYF